MKRTWIWLVVVAALSGGTRIVLADDGDAGGPPDDLERRIEAARQQLDEAAHTLAELRAEQLKSSLSADHPRRAALGVVLAPSGDGGLVVAGLTPGGGAAKAGLRPGDVIVSIDGVAVDETEAPGSLPKMLHLLGDVEPGQTVRVEYDRDGTRASADIVTGEHPAFAMGAVGGLVEPPTIQFFDAPVPPEAPVPPDAIAGQPIFVETRGPPLELRDLDAALGRYFGTPDGVLVLSAPVTEDGLEPGDVIKSVAGTATPTARQCYRALFGAKEEVTVEVLRDGGATSVQVKPLGRGAGAAGMFAPAAGMRDLRVIHSLKRKDDGAGEDVNVDVIVQEE